MGDNNKPKDCASAESCAKQCSGGSCAACSHRSDCGCSRATLAGRGNLQSYNWLKGINDGETNQLVEVLFKNTRKSYYLNTANLHLNPGDVVVVEGSPGQDIGKVTMTGPLVALQMRRANLRSDFEPKRLYRHATENDMERFRAAQAREHDTMIRSRQIAAELGLKMKIGDVEYQGDGHKAIFYYIADERVDFRKLIRILAETFGIRVEMKQIGARQEAGRIGGIGPCGRPLCCATFMTRFASVGTGSARIQDISMNPQKLAGQCAKLKCCLNFEVDSYVEAGKKLPPKDVLLYTKEQDYYFFKADILKHEVTYSTAKNQPVNMITLPAERAFEIIALNKRGIKPDELLAETPKPQKAAEFVEIVGQDSLTRFDKSRRNKKRRGADKGDNKAAEGAVSGRKQRQQKEQNGPEKGKGNRDQKTPQNQPQNQAQNAKRDQLPVVQALPKGQGRKQRQQGGGNNKADKGRQQNNQPAKERQKNEQPKQKPKQQQQPPKSQLPPGAPVSQSAIRMANAKNNG